LPIANAQIFTARISEGPPPQPGGFFFGFAMRGKLWTGRFKSIFLGATDFVGREN
jgi:hypothetical protein